MYSISASTCADRPEVRARSINAMVFSVQAIPQTFAPTLDPVTHPVAAVERRLPEVAEVLQGMLGGQVRTAGADFVDQVERGAPGRASSPW